MNHAEMFWKTYQKNLAEAVRTSPSDYPPGAVPEDYAATVAAKFKALPFSEINHEGRGFRLTCKELGVHQSRKAIAAYLKGEKHA